MLNTKEDMYQWADQITGLLSDGYDDEELRPEANDELAAYLEEHKDDKFLMGLLHAMTNQLEELTP